MTSTPIGKAILVALFLGFGLPLLLALAGAR